MISPILVGAVIYEPKVALIWETIRSFFEAEGCRMDYVFYSNYKLQVDALVEGHIHIAWNSPLAWVDTWLRTGGKCRAIAMRDTDRDRRSHILVRKDDAIRNLTDLRGKTMATGAKDSPQATLIPTHFLHQQGLTVGKDYNIRRFDVLVGKHGDHIGGEQEAIESLAQGNSDACSIVDLNWERWQADGTADPGRLTSLATTMPYDHCNFTVLDSFPSEDEQRWAEVLFSMNYDNPAHREMMEMEGLKAWMPGRTTGYSALMGAVAEQKYFEAENL